MQVLQVAQPLQGQGPVRPGDVTCQVGAVGPGEGGEVIADRQLLPQVEDRVQEIGERVVLEEGGVFQKAQEKIFLFFQEPLQSRKIRRTGIDGVCVPLEETPHVPKIFYTRILAEYQVIPYLSCPGIDTGE